MLQNYYQASAHPAPTSAPLLGETHCDVCVIGGGIAGCSTALHLAQRGYRVVLLEAASVGSGASGRSGGQVLPGYSSGQALLQAQLGATNAQILWDTSVEAVRLTRQLIHDHTIDCDLQHGHLDVAIKPRQRTQLQRHLHELQHQHHYRSLQWLERNELRDWLSSDRYCAALFDNAAAHLHPLNYTLGLARAAVAAGVSIHEHCAAVAIVSKRRIRISTAAGLVQADHAVLCCNAAVGELSRTLAQRIMPVSTYMVATEILGEQRCRELLPRNVAVADTNFILDYFRRSADHRLLFGGRVSYSGRDFGDPAAATRTRMLRVFPQLQQVRIEYSWGGMLDLTLNRAPDFGRLQNNIYYLQGFSGHGMALAGMAGKLAADAIAGQSERFDVFAKLQHHGFPGGPLLRTPALMLAMLWYRLRDLL